jgi:MFS family permease
MTSTLLRDNATTRRDHPVLPSAPRPRLVSRALALRFVSIIGASTSFYLLLSVVPLYAKSAGGGAAGVVTCALMASTVAGELATPRLVTRFGYRRVLAAGLLLLGAPALALPASSGLDAIVAICLVRGLGFALTVVAGGALTAALIPAQRRGEGLALVGVVSGVPSVVALPLGVWLAGHLGYPVVFAAAAAAALVALLSVPGLPGQEPSAGAAIGVTAALRTTALVRLAAIFAATTMGAGIIVTFVPLAAARGSGGLAALALLAQAAAATISRWLAGRHGDRHGPGGLLAPGAFLAAAGMLLLALTSVPIAVLAGAVLFGAGFGITQNASLTLMYSRVPVTGFGAISALWNLAYDGGMGVGAAAFGLLAPHTGYPLAFALAAVPMLAILPMARRSRESSPVPVR